MVFSSIAIFRVGHTKCIVADVIGTKKLTICIPVCDNRSPSAYFAVRDGLHSLRMVFDHGGLFVASAHCSYPPFRVTTERPASFSLFDLLVVYIFYMVIVTFSSLYDAKTSHIELYSI